MMDGDVKCEKACVRSLARTHLQQIEQYVRERATAKRRTGREAREKKWNFDDKIYWIGSAKHENHKPN